MARPRKQIPLDDVHIKGLRTLYKEGKTHQYIADYMTCKLGEKVDRTTISRRIKEIIV